jgi:hypothetical protein
MTVHTRWHRLRDAASGTGPCLAVDEKVALPLDAIPPRTLDAGLFRDFLDAVGASPRFVVPPQLAEMAVTAPAMRSLSDMHVCGVVGMPYPECVIEFDAGIDRYHVHIAEEAGDDGTRSWLCSPVSSYPDGGREIAMAFPAAMRLRLASEEGGDPDNPDIRLACDVCLAPYMADGSVSEGYAAAVHPLVLRRVGAAFLCALLLLNTLGLEREEVRVRPALNRARGKGRHPIPDHTVIRLARYRTETGSERAFDERAPVEVHLRRAHKRRVPVGAGRSGRRWHFFPAQVVGYLPDGRKPALAELIATRAARPYVLSAGSRRAPGRAPGSPQATP